MSASVAVRTAVRICEVKGRRAIQSDLRRDKCAKPKDSCAWFLNKY